MADRKKVKRESADRETMAAVLPALKGTPVPYEDYVGERETVSVDDISSNDELLIKRLKGLVCLSFI